ncbi:hypothetical protein N7470_010353 [Penicillium chermesinum]|nr:hypothetical protein N7470_010353 [Penicillium chermesinum]
MKRAASSDNNRWSSPQESPISIPILSSLKTPVSPPPRKRLSNSKNGNSSESKSATATAEPDTPHDLAAIEAGQVQVDDHLSVISKRLSDLTRPALESEKLPRISNGDWIQLYRRNEHPNGRHFVIHQHDHPVAGPHYDLRLQFSETSSVSWSIMYGLPGDPNSERLNRNATETRVHCLWNHLIETASPKTGSLIIWDTGEYEVLPYEEEQSQLETDDSRSDSDGPETRSEAVSHSHKLKEGFKNRKIRLRLHGTRLPKDYTDQSADDELIRILQGLPPPSTSSSDAEDSEDGHSDNGVDLDIQKNNAYPGSVNTIGSIHQRKWYLSMARESSGFEPQKETSGSKSSSKKRRWVRKGSSDGLLGFDPFYVRGPDFERSVVTGRSGQDVLDDENVVDFHPRRGWRPVLN